MHNYYKFFTISFLFITNSLIASTDQTLPKKISAVDVQKSSATLEEKLLLKKIKDDIKELERLELESAALHIQRNDLSALKKLLKGQPGRPLLLMPILTTSEVLNIAHNNNASKQIINFLKDRITSEREADLQKITNNSKSS